ncbi:AbiV family abortive infection protein [Brevundimonas sp. LPMIX5]|uniref:AbiV family abortive infection protein n=1 Tax=Brevundimonas sp. LPMIX5 TaxID=2305887 RepID=UPI0013149233|nr:AbiV family abortive infection protein [Brevundimonas sp. LPMIX5]
MLGRIVLNAQRLLADADLLMSHRRGGSAIALSVLALEEVGKVVLELWGNPEELRKIDRRWTYHRRKQAAATMLLQADQAISETFVLLKSIDGLRGVTREVAKSFREDLANSIASSKEAKLSRYVALGATERVKHLGLYFDQESYEMGLIEDDHSSSYLDQALEISIEARRAMSLLSNGVVMRAARSLYLLLS